MAFYSNTLAVIRRHVASYVGDNDFVGTFASGSTTTGVHTMLTKGDDYFNEHGFYCYIYGGTNIGAERKCSDWTLTTPANTLTFDPAFASAIDNTSQYELHYKFRSDDYLQAINLALESLADKYYISIKDQTTIRLTSVTDNLGNTKYTWEYALPTNMMYLEKVITERKVSGVKLTGTVSGAFTSGETITGGTSGATGELSYGPAGGTYIRVRKVSGTFSVGETATGTTSSKTCSAITAVDSETAGDGVWDLSDTIDPRYYDIMQDYAPKLKLHEDRYSVDEDLYLRLEGQGTQDRVTADTDVIYLPPEWITMKAVSLLPMSKVIDHHLEGVVNYARGMAQKEPRSYPHPWSRKCYE